MKMKFAMLLAVLASALGTTGAAQSADITWQSPVDNTGPADVLNVGSLVYAGTLGDLSSETVDVDGTDVLFQKFGTSTSSDAYVNATSRVEDNDSAGGVVWSTGSGPLDNVMNSTVFLNGGPMTLTLQNLSIGQEYQIQLFASDARDGHPSRRQQFYSDSITPGSGNESAIFAMGDKSYVVGTFTADATTQSIYTHDGGVGETLYLNAISLTTVPKVD